MSLEKYFSEIKLRSVLFELSEKTLQQALVKTNLIPEKLLEGIEDIGFVDEELERPHISFLDSLKYTNLLSQQNYLRLLITKTGMVDQSLYPTMRVLDYEYPKLLFFQLNNAVASLRLENIFPSKISPLAKISASARIATNSVLVEDDVVVDDNVTIYERVILKRGSHLRAGSVVGSPGFEYKRGNAEILSVIHDGMTLIGEDVEVGPGSVIGQGFYRRPTILGKQVKTDNLVSIAHGSLVGDRTLIAAGAVIAGNVRIGSDVWVGPGAIISNGLNLGANSFIALGSHVFKDVEKGDRVIGSPARSLPRPEK